MNQTRTATVPPTGWTSPGGLPVLSGRRALALLLTALVAIPLVGFALGAWAAWQASWREAEAEVVRAADGAAEYMLRVVEGHDLRLQLASDLVFGMTDADIHDQEQRLHAALDRMTAGRQGAPGGVSLFLLDRLAHPLVSSRLFPVDRARRYDDREFVQALRQPETPEPHVSAVYLGRIDPVPLFSISRRRAGSAASPVAEEFEGLVQASIHVDAAASDLRRLLADPADRLSVVRRDGEILVRTAGFEGAGQRPYRLGRDSPMLPVMERGEDRAVVTGTSTVDGARRIAAFRRIAGWPVYLAAVRDTAVVERRWRGIVAGQLAVGLPAWALLLGMAGLVWRHQRALGHVNTELEQRVAERTAALTESAAQLHLAQQAARIGMWQADLVTGTQRWSEEQWRLLGLDPARDGPPSRALFLSRVHPDDRARLSLAEQETAGETGYETEFRILVPAADGPAQTRWLLGRGRFLPGDGVRNPRIIGLNLDITERHQAEERRTLLARETAHRAKNALHIVAAAVRMTEAPDVEEFARLVEGRVAAIARAQTILGEAGGAGAPFATVVQAAIEGLLGSEAAHVRLDGPDVALGDAAVQAMSMVLHELATNALKYGALSAPGGGVALEWRIEDGTLVLRWTERGGPPVVAPTRQGFGSSVIAATLEGQLGGTLQRDWNAGGLEVTARVPLAMLAPPPAAAAGGTSG